MANGSLDLLSQHYLQVQALTPKGSTEASGVDHAMVRGLRVRWENFLDMFFDLFGMVQVEIWVGVFVGFLAVGVVLLVLGKPHKRFTKIFPVLYLSFTLAALPVGMYVMRFQTKSEVLAGPTVVPERLVVDQIDNDSMRIRWFTDESVLGGVRLRRGKKPKSPQVHFEREETGVHEVVVDHLVYGEYELEIFSAAHWFDNEGQPLRFRMIQVE